MARYTKTYLDTVGCPENPQGTFVGWDHLGTMADEATHADDLGEIMSGEDVMRFFVLDAGQFTKIGGIRYAREY